MARRQTLTQQLRKDFIALAVITCTALGWYAHTNAVFIGLVSSDGLLHWIGRSDPQVEGTIPPSSTETCDTLLILPAPLEEEKEVTFSNLDMASGWFNILTQEIGCFKHMTSDQLTPTSWSTVRLVVVASSASQIMRQDLIDSLGRWVEQGGVLMVEQPDPRWSATTQIPVNSTKPRVTRRLTNASGAFRGALRDAMMGIPLTTTMYNAELGLTQKRVKHNILLEVDARPAFIHASRGDGHCFVLTIDLARAVTTLQQGRPLDDFSLPPSENEEVPEDLTQPFVLVADKKMLDNTVPYADLLERAVMEAVASMDPMARLWYYPDKKSGVFIMTHNEASFGDRATYITDWEAQDGEQSTSFIIPDSMSPEALTRMVQQGHDVQLSWNRGFNHSPQSRPAGIGPWKPIALEMTLQGQKEAVQTHLGGLAVKLSRVHGLTWDKDWSLSFQKLAASPIAADSTYGPTGPKQFGYLFGTGKPFYPLDHSGKLIPVLEIPFLVQDTGNFKPVRFRKLITSSEASYHQVITAVFHNNTMAHSPTVEVMNVWRQIFSFAKRHNHWVTTMRDFLLFEEARRASNFRSHFIVSERRLEVEIDVKTPRIQQKTTTKGKTPVGPHPSLSFPQNYKGNGVESVSLDGASISLRHLGRSGDAFYHILKMPPGKHKVHVIYAGKLIDSIVPED